MKILFLLFTIISIRGYAQLNQECLKNDEKFKFVDMLCVTEFPEAQSNYDSAGRLFDESKFRESIQLFKQALTIDPDFSDACDNLGNSYRYLGIMDSAVFWYKRSIELSPDGIVAHQNLALAYKFMEKYFDALEEYDKMIKIGPENAEGYYGKTNVYLELGRGDEIILNARKAIEIYHKTNDPYEMDAVYMLAVGYDIKKDKVQAKKYFMEAKNMGKEIPAEFDVQ